MLLAIIFGIYVELYLFFNGDCSVIAPDVYIVGIRISSPFKSVAILAGIIAAGCMLGYSWKPI